MQSGKEKMTVTQQASRGNIGIDITLQDPMVEFPGLAYFYQALQETRVWLPRREGSWTGYLPVVARQHIERLPDAFLVLKEDYTAEYSALKDEAKTEDRVKEIEQKLAVLYGSICRTTTYFTAEHSALFFKLLGLTREVLSFRYTVDFSSSPGKTLFSKENIQSLTVGTLQSKLSTDLSYVLGEDEAGNLPISWAVLYGYSEELIEVLLNTFLMWQLWHISCSGKSVFDHAVYYGRADIVRLILTKIPDVAVLPAGHPGLRMMLRNIGAATVARLKEHCKPDLSEKKCREVFDVLQKYGARMQEYQIRMGAAKQQPEPIAEENSTTLWNRKELAEVKKTSTIAEVQADKTERASRKQAQPTAIESIYSFFGISPRVKQSAPSSDKAGRYVKLD